MAETTRTTPGTPNQTASTQTAPTSSPSSTPSGGARTGANPSSTSPSSTAAASPAATTAPSTTTGSSTTRSGSATPAANQGQRTQTQSQDQAQRPSAQGQQNQSQQNQGQQNQGQQRQQNQQAQGQRRGEQGERRNEEYHVELSGDPMSDAKKVGSELVGAARDSAMSLLDAQRGRVADQIGALGDALRQSTESLESTGVGSLAQYANQAADQISGFADTMRDRSWNELAGDLESFARRYPLTFMASAMGLGFMLGRFLLSSSERTYTSMSSGSRMSGVRTTGMRGDMGGAGRTVSSGARAEYGSSMRE